jgi:transposase-like protein
MEPCVSTRSRALLVASPFDDDVAAREALETMRWPDGPRCPRCALATEVFGGEKHSHREGLYHCKACRRQFSVTVGTVLERLRVPLSTWVLAAYAFSRETREAVRDATPLANLQAEIGVSYKTMLRMRDIIQRAARRYKGYRLDFGAWPKSFMKHRATEGKDLSQYSIRSTGVLTGRAGYSKGALRRTECLLRLLLATPKPTTRRK